MSYIGKIPAKAPLTSSDVADDIITLAKMAGGTDGNVITYDTSGNPAVVATGTSGHFLKSQGAGNVPVFAAAGGGKVGQVIQTVDTTIRSMASSSWTSTSISVTITPAASSSKILLNFGGYVGFSTGLRVLFAPYANVGGAGAAIITIPGSRDGYACVAANDTATYQSQSAHINYLHSPSTTSEIVYTMYWNNPGANTVYLGEMKGGANNTCATFFTATEILA